MSMCLELLTPQRLGAEMPEEKATRFIEGHPRNGDRSTSIIFYRSKESLAVFIRDEWWMSDRSQCRRGRG